MYIIILVLFHDVFYTQSNRIGSANMRVFPSHLINDEFLRLYWQKKPLLMRQAVSLPADLVTKSELLALASGSEDVESRLILEHGETPWEAHHGPFERSELEHLPESHWTLLIQDMNKHMPEIRPLLDAFSAIPQWRIDDIMISYAADQGSVGPHSDDYDVFLIQASGKRRWKIHQHPVSDEDLIPDLDLKILKTFDTQMEWLLEPGDMLYLPPNVAHWGVAEGECITWSVGFQGPSITELSSHWLEDRLSILAPQRYTDPDLKQQQHSGEIGPRAIVRISEMLQQALSFSDDELTAWFGRFSSEPKENLTPPTLENSITEADLLQQLQQVSQLRRHPCSKIFYSCLSDSLLLFASGESYNLPADALDLAILLSEQYEYSYQQLQPWLQSPQSLALLTELVNRGDLLVTS
jgi:50S ribosomal protein L16 3-hydroxylase